MKDKSFFNLSIRAKLVIALLVTASVPLSIGGAYAVYYSIKALENTTLHHLEHEVSSKASDIEKFLKTVHNDVLYLSQSSGMRDFVDNAKSSKLRNMLEEEYLAFSKSRPYYYQIRYINEKGNEVIRVDSDGKSSFVVPHEKLQFKGDRYYFTDAMKYEKGECYVSPMDLNIEWGKVELPHKPVVRIATGVFDSKGKRQGIVIVNIFADYLIQQMQMMNIAKGGSTYLVNKDGFYLTRLNSQTLDKGFTPLHPADHDTQVMAEWQVENKSSKKSDTERLGVTGFILGSTEGLNKDFSKDAAAKVLSGKTGTVKEPYRIVSYAPIHTGDVVSKDYWILVLEYPKTQIFASVSRLRIVYIVIGIISILSSVVAGIWMARRLTRPILELHKEVEWIAEGDFNHKLDIRTGDEIESLAERFNSMVDALKESREKILKWNEELKAEVENRTRELELSHIEQQQMEKQLHQADKMASIGELSAGIAHEIGNPLASIKTVIQAMEDDSPLKWEQRKYLNRILKEVDRLAAFIKTFSNFAHPSVKQSSACRIDNVLKDVLFLIRKEAVKQGIVIDEAIGNDNLDVQIDPQQMQQIFINLLLNAIQAMPEGGNIRIEAGCNGSADKDFVNPVRSSEGCGKSPLDILSKESALSQTLQSETSNWVKVSISDTGCGISQEQMDKIFNPFFTTKPTGTGLGLSIVQKIINECNGRITVSSAAGKGTTFNVFLPGNSF